MGIVIGPLITSEYMAVLHYHNGRPDMSFMDYFPYTPLLALNYYFFMLPIAFLTGVPAYFALVRINYFNGISVSLYGGVVGIIAAHFLTSGSNYAYMFFGSGGFLSAVIAWFVIKYRSNQALKKKKKSGAA